MASPEELKQYAEEYAEAMRNREADRSVRERAERAERDAVARLGSIEAKFKGCVGRMTPRRVFVTKDGAVVIVEWHPPATPDGTGSTSLSVHNPE